MSMNLYVLRLAQDEVAAVRRNPDSAAAMTEAATIAGMTAGLDGFPPGPKFDLDIAPLRPPGLGGRLAWPFAKRDPARPSAAESARSVDPARLLDLHKSWHVLHFLFTGDPEGGIPPANALLAGRELGKDLGYGPPRLHDAAATAAFARFLAPLTVDELQARIDLKRMNDLGIYCCDDADDEGTADEIADDVDHYFPQLQSFVGDAAREANGLLVWMS